MITAGLIILLLAYIQNVSFSVVSRSRNRDNMKYHIIAATASNTIWFLTFKQLIISDMAWFLIPFYVVGTVAGSVSGVKVSMWIEKLIGAKADTPAIKKLEKRIESIESQLKIKANE